MSESEAEAIMGTPQVRVPAQCQEDPRGCINIRWNNGERSVHYWECGTMFADGKLVGASFGAFDLNDPSGKSSQVYMLEPDHKGWYEPAMRRD